MLYPTRSRACSWGLWDIPARGLSLGHTWSISPPGEEDGEFSNTSYLFWQTATASFHTFAIFSFRLHCSSWAPIENDLQMSLLFYAFAFFYLMFWLCFVELFQSKAWWRLFLHCNEILFILTSRRALSLSKKVFVPLFPSIWNEHFLMIHLLL